MLEERINGTIRWYNIDLPVAIELRTEYIHENDEETGFYNGKENAYTGK